MLNPEMLALAAVADHGVKNRLPAPREVTFSDNWVWLYCDEGDWADTLHVDDHRCDPPTVEGWVRVAVSGRLPDSGTRVVAVYWEQLWAVEPPD